MLQTPETGSVPQVESPRKECSFISSGGAVTAARQWRPVRTRINRNTGGAVSDRERRRKRRRAFLCVDAGDTPRGVFRHVAKRSAAGGVSRERLPPPLRRRRWTRGCGCLRTATSMNWATPIHGTWKVSVCKAGKGMAEQT